MDARQQNSAGGDATKYMHETSLVRNGSANYTWPYAARLLAKLGSGASTLRDIEKASWMYRLLTQLRLVDVHKLTELGGAAARRYWRDMVAPQEEKRHAPYHIPSW